uniref:Uncharacterized protein n=1 Tax=Cacopsylla melanoneura TaxID=428564 RepID=A0A8D8VKC8_9HEMI
MLDMVASRTLLLQVTTVSFYLILVTCVETNNNQLEFNVERIVLKIETNEYNNELGSAKQVESNENENLGELDGMERHKEHNDLEKTEDNPDETNKHLSKPIITRAGDDKVRIGELVVLQKRQYWDPLDTHGPGHGSNLTRS